MEAARPGDTRPISFAFLFVMEGAAAAHAGEPASANPYELSIEQGVCWLSGWLQKRNALHRA